MKVLVQEVESNVIQLEITFLVGLLIITLVAILVRRVKIPYTVALVLAGLGLAFVPAIPLINPDSADSIVTSELILALFVPPLIFEGALHISWKSFRDNLRPILLMAVVGVLLGTFIVGSIVAGIGWAVDPLAAALNLPQLQNLDPIPFAAAIAFGALISATDPVAVIAFFRSLGVGKRLSMLVEGESLLNDGTSIVIFNLALTLGGAAAGSLGATEFNLLMVVWDFTRVAVGGLIVGLLVGFLVDHFFLRPLDERLVETTVTMLAAFGSFILAEQLHLSGILAVVAAGIYIGNALPGHTTPTTKVALFNFWEIVAFVVTSLIFLLIGTQIDIRDVISPQNIVLVLAAVVAILVSRTLVVYGMSALSGRLGTPIPRSYQHIMFWGGLRGAISLALALSLSSNAFGTGVGAQLRLMTFGVVLFTLLVQGTTIEGLLKRLGLAHRSPRQIEKEQQMGRFYAARAARIELERLHERGMISGSLWEAMLEAQEAELQQHDRDLQAMWQKYPGMSTELALQARRAMLRAERTALAEANRQEIISEEVQQEMMELIDARMELLRLLEERGTTVPLLEEKRESGEL